MTSTWFFLKEISMHHFLSNCSSFDNIMLRDIFILIWSFIVGLNLWVFTLYCMRFKIVWLHLKKWFDYFMILVIDEIFRQRFIYFRIRTWNFVWKFRAYFLFGTNLAFLKHRRDSRNSTWIIWSLISTLKIFVQTLKSLLLFLLIKACENHFVLL